MKIDAKIADKLTCAGLRPTRQRQIIGARLWQGDNRHVTAEQLHNECKDAGCPVSMATVYNTLHQFVDAQLLSEVVVENGSCYFDTNMEEHHHFYYEDSGRLEDIPAGEITIADMPLPKAALNQLKSVQVIIRMHEDPIAN